MKPNDLMQSVAARHGLHETALTGIVRPATGSQGVGFDDAISAFRMEMDALPEQSPVHGSEVSERISPIEGIASQIQASGENLERKAKNIGKGTASLSDRLELAVRLADHHTDVRTASIATGKVVAAIDQLVKMT
jgi:hypothetical protein